jgi:hypothetical protein
LIFLTCLLIISTELLKLAQLLAKPLDSFILNFLCVKLCCLKMSFEASHILPALF